MFIYARIFKDNTDDYDRKAYRKHTNIKQKQS